MFSKHDTIRLYDELRSCQTEQELSAVVTTVTADLGFNGFSFIHINTPHGSQALERRNEDWMQRYEKLAYAARDPIVLHCLKARETFGWSDVRSGYSLPQRQIMAEAWEFGVRDGLIIPMPADGVSKGFFGYVSEKNADTDAVISRYRSDLELLGLMFFDTFQRITAKGAATIDLTQRETEVLTWAARGKTSIETALILKISPETVKAHIARSIRKLDAVNRTQAVTKALCMNLIAC